MMQSAFFLGGVVALCWGFYMWSLHVSERPACVFNKPASCAAYSGQNSTLANFLLLGTGTAPTGVTVSEAFSYTSCAPAGTSYNAMLESKSIRPIEVCVAAGCRYSQCLEVRSTCTLGVPTAASYKCVDPSSWSELKLSSFFFSFINSAIGVALIVLSLVCGKKCGGTTVPV